MFNSFIEVTDIAQVSGNSKANVSIMSGCIELKIIFLVLKYINSKTFAEIWMFSHLGTSLDFVLVNLGKLVVPYRCGHHILLTVLDLVLPPA